MKKFNFRIFGLFIFIIFSWGLAWPVNKIGLNDMSPVWYTTTRMIIGTVTMMLIVIPIGKFKLPQWRDAPLILTVGLLQISIYMLLANLGLEYLPAGRSSLLGYTTPLWVMPLATLFFHEESGWVRWLGFMLGMTGLIILMSPWEFSWSNSRVLFGSAMLLLGSLCWGISMLCVRYMHWRKSPLELIPWQLLIGTIPVLILALAQEPTPTVHFTFSLFISLLYTGVLVTGFSYWGGVVINKEIPATIASLGFLMVPVFSIIVSSLFMHEVINLPTGIAMGLIVLGIFCIVV